MMGAPSQKPEPKYIFAPARRNDGQSRSWLQTLIIGIPRHGVQLSVLGLLSPPAHISYNLHASLWERHVSLHLTYWAAGQITAS